jgi:gamma-glutamylcyclotransferase (GGCT)/AIG2-like uncharacterized protein YtfP
VIDRLFCYGTLMVPELFESISGVKALSQEAILPGYRRSQLQRRAYPGIAQHAGSEVQGCVYRGLGPRLLKRLDVYEGEMYQRKLVNVHCADNRSVKAWCYVIRDFHAGKLAHQEWSLDHFLQHYLDQAMAGLKLRKENVMVQADRLIR